MAKKIKTQHKTIILVVSVLALVFLSAAPAFNLLSINYIGDTNEALYLYKEETKLTEVMSMMGITKPGGGIIYEGDSLHARYCPSCAGEIMVNDKCTDMKVEVNLKLGSSGEQQIGYKDFGDRNKGYTSCIDSDFIAPGPGTWDVVINLRGSDKLEIMPFKKQFTVHARDEPIPDNSDCTPGYRYDTPIHCHDNVAQRQWHAPPTCSVWTFKDWRTCPYDCIEGVGCSEEAIQGFCGDSKCGEGEDAQSCPGDCTPVSPEPEPDPDPDPNDDEFWCYSYNAPTGEHGDACFSSTVSDLMGEVCFDKQTTCIASLNQLIALDNDTTNKTDTDTDTDDEDEDDDDKDGLSSDMMILIAIAVFVIFAVFVYKS